MAKQEGRKVVASNRKARHDYDVIETFEAGLQLIGSEVKSLRAGSVQIKDGFAMVRGGEAWLENVHIAPYQFAREGGHDPERSRKLLLKRREIDRLAGTLAEKGLTLVPLSIYFSDGLAKVELGLVKGRRMYDKRQAIRQREEQREMDRAVRRTRR
ncbi:MAG: SsrA-binding protein SmpB [Acidimicrobiia bacterium]